MASRQARDRRAEQLLRQSQAESRERSSATWLVAWSVGSFLVCMWAVPVAMLLQGTSISWGVACIPLYVLDVWAGLSLAARQALEDVTLFRCFRLT